MISICIPVYNFDVTSLVSELSEQAKSLPKPYEVILIDDCSDNKYKAINRNVCKSFIYIELAENIGRSRIRNLFLRYAKYDYLLFIDCDSIIESSDFLLKYLEIIEQNPGVVCGGRIYKKFRPPRDKMLRWKYGLFRESQPSDVRNKFPYKSFMTSNFLIDRKILAKIRFDERITKYGHEDTLFGYSLKKGNISIDHINNPVVNGDLENNMEYLNKTAEGIGNLVNIIRVTNYDKDLINSITILRIYSKVRRLEKFIKLSFIVLKPLIIFLLSRGYVNLYLFDFYKLGILIEEYKK
jgi:glycosyltransferase involved in cell wall biosynthesis